MDDECQLLEEDQQNRPTDDDPLIAEVDVYLTRIFADQLYLFQYPLRPTNLQFEGNRTFLGARLKPKNKLVQLDQVLETESAFHCQTNERHVCENWSSTTSTENITSVDRLTLSSTNITPADSYKRFAVGMLTTTGIQLSPLNAIFQLRPNFDSTSALLVQQSVNSNEEEIVDETDPVSAKQSADETTTDEETSNELVTMKFWRPEGRVQRERKMRSYNYLERARNEERWIDFAYYSPHEFPANDLRNKWMTMDDTERTRLPIRWRKTLTMDDYFRLLFFDKNMSSSFESPLNQEKTIPSESNVAAIEQKPLIVPPTKPKKKKKTDLEKTTKKTSRKNSSLVVICIGRSLTRKSTDSTATSTTEQQAGQTTMSTPLSSVSLPKTIIKPDPETIQNALLTFMKRRFGYRPYFKLNEINIAIKLDLISSPPGHALASGVTEASILRSAAEIGAIYVNKKWPKNLKQEPVFINTQMGDKYDLLRRYVADLLEKCDSFQFTELRSRIKQENQTQQFPVHEVKKFVKDHCITRSSRKGVLYCVKGTLVK